jgi:putative inorganic carbon (hco3(-)) transporter
VIVITDVLPAPWGQRAVRAVVIVATGLGAFVLGFALALVASFFGDASPWVFIALPLVPLLALAIIVAPTFGIMLAFLTFPVGKVIVPTGILPLQSTEAGVMAIVAVVAVLRLARGQLPLPWSPPLYWALALLAWTLAGIGSAIDEALALKQIASLFGGIIFACALLAACRHMDDLRLVLGGLIAVCAGIAITSFAGGFQLHSTADAQTVSGRLQGAFDHPNQLGALCALATPTALGLAFGARTLRARVAAALAGLVIFVALLFTLSRGAWVGTALALLFFLVTLREARRALMLLAVPAAILAAVVTSFAPVGRTEIDVVGERARAITTLSPYDNRGSIYREAEREIKGDPLTGVGAGGFPIASARAGSESSTVSAAHAHNLWLNWGAEAGIPAMLILAGLVIAIGGAARRARIGFKRAGRARDRALVAGLAAALLGMLGQGMFDYVFRNAVVSIAAWGLIGGLLVCLREARRAPVRRPLRLGQEGF